VRFLAGELSEGVVILLVADADDRGLLHPCWKLR
jgi:hypothetical protein